ncbi:hypothetical protein [Microtetraspora malaysiensis]|uniref:hypothetical protein n=1 Tax=Microtetraspora malaysiensis TaxID=161358 RepID=UPI003D930DE7
MTPEEAHEHQPRLWVMVIATAGVFLAWPGGTPTALAILVGATGFAGFVGLDLAIANFLTRPQS